MRAAAAGILALLVAAGCLDEATLGTAEPTATPTSGAPDCSRDIEATIDTTKGAIQIVLYGTRSPLSVCNFLRYAQEDYYDNTIWHRICTHVVQTGGYDPFAVPGMQQKPTHEPIPHEGNASKLRNYERTLGVARDEDPDSGTAHFYVNLKDNLYLDYDGQYAPGYVVFGNVTGGWEVVQQIAATQTVPDPPREAGPLYQGCEGKPAPGQQTTIRDVRIES